MVRSIEQAQVLYERWKKLKSDNQRLDFLMEQSHRMKIILDNDESHVEFITPNDLDEQVKEAIEELSSELYSFDQYFGENDSILLLFQKLGITAESV